MNKILELQKVETPETATVTRDWSTISNTCNNH